MKHILFEFRTLILLLLLIITSSSSHLQKLEFNLNDLIGKKWSMQGMTDKTYEEYYSRDSVTLYFNKKYFGTLEYYLSDSINKVFDSSKVGKIMEGKYIVTIVIKPTKRPTDLRPVSVYEIIELTQDTLIMRNKNQDLLEFVSQ